DDDCGRFGWDAMARRVPGNPRRDSAPAGGGGGARCRGAAAPGGAARGGRSGAPRPPPPHPPRSARPAPPHPPPAGPCPPQPPDATTVTRKVPDDAHPSDPRLPSPGSAIVRQYKGKTIRVVVLEDDRGFEYQGDRYRTLSAVAKVVTGSHMNGFRFFRL